MLVRVGSSAKARRVAWYDPCDNAALDAVLRAACGVPAERQFLLLDATMSAVAVSSSLPSGETFELVMHAKKYLAPSHRLSLHPLLMRRRLCCRRRVIWRLRLAP